MSDDLLAKLIRMAHENPTLRKDLLPLIKKNAASNEHKVTLPDGTVRTRNSKKVYTHVVAVKLEPGDYHYEKGFRWGVMGWTSRLDLAQKMANKYRGKYPKVLILEAEPA